MAAKTKNSSLGDQLARLARIHFAYILIYVVSIVVYDAWQLIPPDAVLSRWTLAAAMLAIVTLIWYTARKNPQPLVHKAGIWGLIAVDILVASFLVYAERGMAARTVFLFVVPLVSAAVLQSRTALFAVASLCTAAYSLSAVRYFVVNFNEGYKIELYITIAFYSALFFVLAGLLAVVISPNKNS